MVEALLFIYKQRSYSMQAVSMNLPYLVRPSEGRMRTMKTSSTKHLCIVTWFSPDLSDTQNK